ncbi:tail tube protein [Lactococcus phage PLG-II]|nr:tail tube protein [Lactococcus phage PLG-II]
MKLNYDPREIFYGNEALVVADVAKGVDGKIETSNIKLVTGLVSVGAMEDQAENKNYPADDVPDHGFKKGATLLQGSMKFIQTSQALREDLMGWVATENGLGYSPTGNFKTKLVQYLIKGKRRNMDTGKVEEGWRVVIYPQLTPTAEATSESETDSVDGVDPIQWEVAVQATASDIYTNQGYKVPQIEFTIWGEQAKAYEKKMEEGLFILLPDTVIEGGTPKATSVTLDKTTTSIKVGADVTLKATVAPSGASQVVTWSSSDDTKAKVSASGKVTAIKPGTATITATTASNKIASCAVTVTTA